MSTSNYIEESKLRTILAEYDLGEYIESHPFSYGTVQLTVWVRTATGQFAVKLYRNRTVQSVQFEAAVLTYLTKENFPCVRIHENNKGCAVGSLDGRPFMVTEFVVGETTEAPNRAQQAELIHWIARLHHLTGGKTWGAAEARLNYGVETCLRLAKEAATNSGTENSAWKLSWLKAELDSLELPEGLPKGICHGDLHFSNLLYRGNSLVAMLDFDDANVTYLVFDLIGLLEKFAWRYGMDEVLNFSLARDVVCLYEELRPLSHVEREHLFDVFKLAILIDCVWYFERGGPDDFYEKRKIEFLNSVGRQQFMRTLFG